MPASSYRRAVDRYFLSFGLAFASVGAARDVRDGRIPNWLTYSGILSALAVRSLLSGWSGLRSGFFGMLADGAIFALFFFLGGMGGGDVKLMAAVGAWAGIAQAFIILVATVIAGGILAVGYVVYRRRVFLTILNTMELLQHHLASGIQPHPELNIREQATLRVPYGLAIAIGTLYCLARTLSWG